MSSFSKIKAIESDSDFCQSIDHWVELALSKGSDSLKSLLLNLPGVDPGEAIASLNRLYTSNLISKQILSKLEGSLADAKPSNPAPISDEIRQFHPEHPLDYEWYFTQETQQLVHKHIGELAVPAGTILCLGCPTVFDSGRRLASKSKYVLWDKNVIDHGELWDVGTSHGILSTDTEKAAAAIIDPPWYNEYHQLFLWTALQQVRQGGHILVSFSPEGTRPSARTDLNEFLKWSSLAGAELLQHHQGYLSYRSPLFETNAFKARGLQGVPLDWRKGDLLVFEKRATPNVDLPKVLGKDASWKEFRVGKTRFKLQNTASDAPSTLIVPVGPTEILPSVSARYPKRKEANLVTSGNRFYRAQQTSDLLRIFEDDILTMTPEQLSRARLPDSLCKLTLQLKAIIESEDEEAKQYMSNIHGL